MSMRMAILVTSLFSALFVFSCSGGEQNNESVDTGVDLDLDIYLNEDTSLNDTNITDIGERDSDNAEHMNDIQALDAKGDIIEDIQEDMKDSGVDGGIDADDNGDGLDASACNAVPDLWSRTPGEVSTAIVFVPSLSAGTQGIAVHISWPKKRSGARYAKGAPVVVVVPGAGKPDTGTLPGAGAAEYAEWGFVSLFFLFPGGATPPPATISSGGTFDYRGDDCLRAFVDVVRFATGAVAAKVPPSGEEKRISDIVGYPVLASNIGILAISHGGNLATVAMDRYGNEMAGVAWYVGWETPVGDQFITVELGGHGKENPYYVPHSCAASSCSVDYTKIALDTSVPAFVEDSAAIPPPETVPLPGTVFFDTDGDGVLDASEFSVSPWAGRPYVGGPLLGFFSVEMTEALEARGLVSGAIATSFQSREFWRLRDASALGGRWAGAVAHLPTLGVMVLATETDHVQSTPDHAHIKVQIDGWRAAKAPFVRLNPDSAYLAQVGVPSPVDNPANRDMTWDEVLSGLEPESTEKGETLYAAAIEEMADRVQAGCWEANMATPLWY